MLAEERARLHPLPAAPYTVAFGVTRTVGRRAMVSFEGGQYSVPHQLAGQAVWVRRHGEQVVIVHVGDGGPAEVARHPATTPGSPQLDDAHFPPAPPGALGRTPQARTTAEASSWPSATAPGCGWPRPPPPAPPDAGQDGRRGQLAACTARRGGPGARPGRHAGRFGEGDLASILAHQARRTGQLPGRRAATWPRAPRWPARRAGGTDATRSR